MPGPVLLSELVTRVRRRADMENTTFVSDAEIEEYVEQSAGDLLDLMIETAGPDMLSVTSAEGTTVSGTDTADLSNISRIYKITGVDVKFDGKWRTIRRLNFQDRTQHVDSDGTWSGPGSVFYRSTPLTTADLWDTSANLNYEVRWFPSPPSGMTYRVRYIPYPIDASEGQSLYWQGYSGWDEYIVVDAAMKCLEKEESDTRHLERRLARMIERIRHHAQTMDTADAGSIGDVHRSMFDDCPEYLPWTTA